MLKKIITSISDKNINIIPEKDLDSVINSLYSDRKEHLKIFIKESLKKIMKRII